MASMTANEGAIELQLNDVEHDHDDGEDKTKDEEMANCPESRSMSQQQQEQRGGGGGDTIAHRPRNRPHVGALDGVRVISALVVVFHHIGSLDPDLLRHNRLGITKEGERRVLGLADQINSTNPFTYMLGLGPGNIAVETFLIVSGFVASYETWGIPSNHREILYKSMIVKRFWRLAIPLVPVHVLHVVLWSQGIAYGNYARFPSRKAISECFHQGIRFVYCSELNGALWIVEVFFLAPFVAIGIQIPIVDIAQRSALGVFAWYSMVFVYLGGNFVDESTISRLFPVGLGVLLSDLYTNMHIRNPGFEKAHIVVFLAMFLPWLPPPVYGHRLALSACSFGFVYLSVYNIVFRKVSDNWFMNQATKYTYQLYIWHLVVLHTFGASVQPHLQHAKAVLYITGYASVFIVAFAAYWIVERPATKLTSILCKPILR